MLLSDQLAADFEGETGLYLSSIAYGHSRQARELGAISPSEQERLAQEEADRASAWLIALEAECAQPGGSWELSQPDPDDSDATGSFDGHPIQDEGSTQYRDIGQQTCGRAGGREYDGLQEHGTCPARL